MQVKIDDYTYFVLFQVQHHQPPVMIEAAYPYKHGKRKGQPKQLLITATTICIIKRALTEAELTSKTALAVATGEAWCSAKDWFEVHEGRRESLHRALNALLDRPEFQDVPKKPFWEAFVKTLPKTQPSVKQLKKQVRALTATIEKAISITEEALR